MIRLFNRIDRVIDKIYTFLIKRNFKHFGNNSIISFKCRFDMPSNISIGDNVTICKNVWLNGGDKKRDDNNPTLIIGNGAQVGSNCHISAFNEVTIADEVLFAENVYSGATEHRKTKKDIPMIKQGNIIKNPIKVQRASP